MIKLTQSSTFFFYWVPTIFTYTSFVLDILTNIGTIYLVITQTPDEYTLTIAIIGVVIEFVINSVYTFVPQIIANYEYFGTF